MPRCHAAKRLQSPRRQEDHGGPQLPRSWSLCRAVLDQPHRPFFCPAKGGIDQRLRQLQVAAPTGPRPRRATIAPARRRAPKLGNRDGRSGTQETCWAAPTIVPRYAESTAHLPTRPGFLARAGRGGWLASWARLTISITPTAHRSIPSDVPVNCNFAQLLSAVRIYEIGCIFEAAQAVIFRHCTPDCLITTNGASV